jgi:membrane protein
MNMFDKLMSYGFMADIRAVLKRNRALNSRKSWYDFLNRMVEKITGAELSTRAAAVSYNLILAIFPFIIFLFTLIPYIPIPNLDNQIMLFMGRVLPAGTFDSVGATIRDIVSRPRGGVLSIGFLLTLYAATSGVVALMTAFNASHESKEKRSFLMTRITAVSLTITLVLALFLAIVVLVIGGVVTEYVVQFGIFNNQIVLFLLTIGRYLLVFGVFAGAISIIYKYGPDVDLKWTFVTPGSLTASVLIVASTLAFSYYVANFGSYNKVYGSIGTLIALMVWLNLVMLLVIIGFEMNISLFDLEGNKKPSVARKTTTQDE